MDTSITLNARLNLESFQFFVIFRTRQKTQLLVLQDSGKLTFQETGLGRFQKVFLTTSFQLKRFGGRRTRAMGPGSYLKPYLSKTRTWQNSCTPLITLAAAPSWSCLQNCFLWTTPDCQLWSWPTVALTGLMWRKFCFRLSRTCNFWTCLGTK